MLKGSTPSSKFFGRFGLVLAIGVVCLTITAASTNAAGFSFMDSVKEFFGLETASATAPDDHNGRILSAFTPGNLVVYRVGDGVAALTSNGTAVFWTSTRHLEHLFSPLQCRQS